MDSITQAVLGAAIGESLLGKKVGKKGAISGAIIATIPDLDVILYLFYSPYAMLSLHRGFSHSIVFSILVALLIAWLLHKTKSFQTIKYKTLLLFSWLCLFTHLLLDTFTAYGTQLFLPFSKQRVGFDSINVVDPVYTIPLIMGLILSLWIFRQKPNRSKFANYGLIISTFYLMFTLYNKQQVKAEITNRLSSENIEYSALLTMPVGIANINWYGVAKGKDSIYMQQYTIFSDMQNPIESFAINEHYLNQIDESVAETMRWFAKGFYTVEKIHGKVRVYNLQVDMRGIVKQRNQKAPTTGYFEIGNDKGEMVFSSGSIKKD